MVIEDNVKQVLDFTYNAQYVFGLNQMVHDEAKIFFTKDSFLVKDPFRDDDLADVVQQTRVLEQFDFRFRQIPCFERLSAAMLSK